MIRAENSAYSIVYKAKEPIRSGWALQNLVRKEGLEPSRRKAQEPKSCVSANFTTRAFLRVKPKYLKDTTA